MEATTRPGKGAREPGTGIALWYTRATRAGAFYGAAERWDGVGVVLDTSERRVLVLRNDGTHTGGTVLGSCAANVPNTAQVRLRVRSDHVAHTLRVDVALHPRAPWFACWRGAVALPPLLKLGVTASSRNAPFLVHSLTLGHSEPEDETNLRTLRQDETKMFALADKAADATAARLARATAGLCHVALEVAALAGTGESHDAALSEAVFVIFCFSWAFGGSHFVGGWAQNKGHGGDGPERRDVVWAGARGAQRSFRGTRAARSQCLGPSLVID